MAQKHNEADPAQVSHLQFFQTILAFLQAFHGGEKHQKETLTALKKDGKSLLGQIPTPHKRGDVDLGADLDEIFELADGYYPELESSEELRAAIEKFSHHLQKPFGLAPL